MGTFSTDPLEIGSYMRISPISTVLDDVADTIFKRADLIIFSQECLDTSYFYTSKKQHEETIHNNTH